MKKSELLFNVLIAGIFVQSAVVLPSVAQEQMAQSTLDQWQRLVPGTDKNLQLPLDKNLQALGITATLQVTSADKKLQMTTVPRNLQPSSAERSPQMPVREVVPQPHFIDPFDAEMHDAQSSLRRGQWGQAWESLRRGLRSATDPQSNAARLEIESQRRR